MSGLLQLLCSALRTWAFGIPAFRAVSRETALYGVSVLYADMQVMCVCFVSIVLFFSFFHFIYY